MAANGKTPLSVDHALKARAQNILAKLKAAGITIVTAESCTAGAIAAILSRADGASDVLHGGFVTYTKAQKTAALGVSQRVLKEHEAVNEEVVRQLAAGAMERSPAALGLAVSGVLGPEEDEDGNPVGLVYFCTLTKGGMAQVAREEFGKQPPDQLLELVIIRAFDLIELSLRPAHP